MTNRLEDLWKSANDGASTPIGPLAVRPESEIEALLDAWYAERSKGIECAILLEQSRELIRRLLLEPNAKPARRRQAQRLIRAIDWTLRAAGARDI